MGYDFDAKCLDCNHIYYGRSEGGMCFDLVRCNGCGRSKSVAHQSVRAQFTAWMKTLWLSQLEDPNARDREHLQRLVDTHSDVVPLSDEEYHRAVEATLRRCKCGGAYTYDAPVRCPKCRSTAYEDLGGGVMYD